MTDKENDILLGEIKNSIEDIRIDVTDIKDKLLGNGTAGLLIQVDRLEQEQKRAEKKNQTYLKVAIGLAVPAFIGVAGIGAKTVFSLLSYSH